MRCCKKLPVGGTLNNVRLAVKYMKTRRSLYKCSTGPHSDSFTVPELMEQIGEYGRMIKLGDWSIVFGYLDYLPTDGQQPVYDIYYYGYQLGTYGPPYYYDE